MTLGQRFHSTSDLNWLDWLRPKPTGVSLCIKKSVGVSRIPEFSLTLTTLWHLLRKASGRRCLLLLFALFAGQNQVFAQVTDKLDSLPLQWQLAENDCRARVIKHQIDPTGGNDHRPCEAITLSAGHGTRLLLEYRITPARVIDELNAKLWVRSAQAGVRIGMRIRYPYVHDPESGRTETTILFGQAHRRPGKWDRLAIGGLRGPMREREAALRVKYGPQVDLRDPFVDSIVVDVYNRPGMMTIRLDDLTVEQMVPVGSVSVSGQQSFKRQSGAPLAADQMRDETPMRSLFPTDQTTRIIEYNQEPLTYLRSIGFDAVLLAEPPTDAILREANRAKMMVYAPPPIAPNPDWEPLLDNVAGWYLGTSKSLADQPDVRAEVQRLQNFPRLWQRPSFVAPAEAWGGYAGIVPALLYDMPPTTLGMVPAEEADYLRDIRERTNRSIPFAIGIQTSPAASLVRQVNALADQIGAEKVSDYGWHPMWLQTMRALQACPRAILFRSSTSLASGSQIDQQRALAAGFVNRCVEAVGPLVARAQSAGAMRCTGADYNAHRLNLGPTDVVIATSNSAGPISVLAGDGDVLEVHVPATMAHRYAWRLTGMTAERIDIESTPTGPSLQVISPDVAELLLLSDDPALGHRISTHLADLAMPAALDRWQLTSESVFQTRLDWESVVSTRLAPSSAIPSGLLAGAANTLVEGEPLYRAGEGAATLRLARRADAWMLRAKNHLLANVLPDRQTRYSFPALFAPGGMQLQVALTPRLRSGSWSRNLLPLDPLESPQKFAESGWAYDRRLESVCRSNFDVIPIERMPSAQSPFSSNEKTPEFLAGMDSAPIEQASFLQSPNQSESVRAMRVEVVAIRDTVLPGGYAGTAARVQSPSVDCPPSSLIRVNARMRTIGFGGPFQGVLVYDSLGGPELGVLVRSPDEWQQIEIYRQTTSAASLKVMFEVIGAGEVLIDDVQVRTWDAQAVDQRQLRPISPDLRVEQGSRDSSR